MDWSVFGAKFKNQIDILLEFTVVPFPPDSFIHLPLVDWMWRVLENYRLSVLFSNGSQISWRTFPWNVWPRKCHSLRHTSSVQNNSVIVSNSDSMICNCKTCMSKMMKDGGRGGGQEMLRCYSALLTIGVYGKFWRGGGGKRWMCIF